MNYLTEQADKSVSQRLRRCMAVQVAAAKGHHLRGPKGTVTAAWEGLIAVKDARFGRELFHSLPQEITYVSSAKICF